MNECSGGRCSYAGSPRWVKDAECKCNAMQSNVIISPIMHLKVVPNWSAMALNGTKLAPTWARTTQFEFTVTRIRVYSCTNPCLHPPWEPKWSKDLPNRRQDGPSWSQVGRKWAQDGPSWVHFGSKLAKFNTKSIQSGFK